MRTNLAVISVAVLMLGAGPAWAGYADTVLADNPVAYWRLNEPFAAVTLSTLGSDPTLTASINGGVLGAAGGTYYGLEPANTAMDVTGTSRGALVDANTPQLDNWTIEAVAQAVVITRNCFIGADASGGNNDWVMGTNSSNAQAGKWDVEVQTSTGDRSVGGTATAGVWAHVMATYDGTTMRLYVDGAEVGTPVEQAGMYLRAGRPGLGYSYTKGYGFNGHIDELAIYNTGLSAGDVWRHYRDLALIPGDANIDYTVDTQDFTILKANFAQDPAVWGQGNFNDDTVVDTQDFTILKAHFGESFPAAGASAPAPEPATLVLLAAGGLMLLKRRTR